MRSLRFSFSELLAILLCFLLPCTLAKLSYGQAQPAPEETPQIEATMEERIEEEVEKRLAEREEVLREELEKRLAEGVAKAKAEAKEKEELIRRQEKERASLYLDYLKKWYDLDIEQTYDLLVRELQVYIGLYEELEGVDEAQYMLADTYRKQNEYGKALVGFLKLLCLYPNSRYAPYSKGVVSELTNKKFKDQKDAILEVIEAAGKVGDRASLNYRLIKGLYKIEADELYGIFIDECRDFMRRSPTSAKVDEVQLLMSDLYRRNEKPHQAIAGYDKVLAVYPESALRPAARLNIGHVRYQNFEEYEQAIRDYQRVADDYPETPEVLVAYKNMAKISEEKLKRYPSAIFYHEKIVEKYPGTDHALEAFYSIARLYETKLKGYRMAVKAYKRVADMFPGKEAVEALHRAAEIAEKRLKDYPQTISLYELFVQRYPQHEKAPEALFQVGEIYEKRLKDTQKAIDAYKRIASNWPDSGEAREAQEKIDDLSKE